MNTLNTESSSENISSDELMLKELERRDGIYSFIFHELEAPRDTSKAQVMSDQQANQGHQPRSCEPTTQQVVEQNVQQQEQEMKNEFEEVSSSSCNSGNTSSSCSSSCSSSSTSSGTTSNRRSRTSVSSVRSIGSCSQMSAKLSPAPVRVPLPPCNMHYFQEYLKPWNPPASLVYDHPQLYAYMANCGFRVRIPPPRFSHVSTPLVRNRRHALKDTAEYKRCGVGLLKTPDLRMLFPLDPDVHAPFGGLPNQQKFFKYMN